MPDVNYSKRLIEWRKSLALTQVGLAAAIGVSRGYIGDIEAGRSEPSRGFLQKLTERYGVRADWILYGTGAQTAESEASTLAQILTTNNSDAVSARWAAIYGPNATVAQIREAEGFGYATVADMFARFEREEAAQVKIDLADYAIIPLHEAWLSAGPGIANAGANIVDHLAFRHDWLARIGVSASHSCLARVSGESMFPTLSPGDMVLLDTSRTDPPVRNRATQDKRRPMIWALLDDGQARIKRIERLNADTMFLVSDNPDHPPELRVGPQLAQVQIIGKVIWWGHTATG